MNEKEQDKFNSLWDHILTLKLEIDALEAKIIKLESKIDTITDRRIL